MPKSARNILLVEDDAAIATVIIAALEDEGFTITHCTSIAERDRLLEAGRFGVMLTSDGRSSTSVHEGSVAVQPQADAAHAAGLAAGGVTCEDPPGWRDAGGGRRLYLAYLRDPAGNKLCLLHRPSKAA